jgi:methionine-gamma-lyase
MRWQRSRAATKYLSGHGDAVSGVVAGPKALTDPIRKQTDTLGQAASPFSSFLVQRGVRTLPLRSRAASANAARIAAFLDDHPKVDWVRYPGLASHPDHVVAKRLLGDRFGAMVTFKPLGDLTGMAAFTDHLRLCDIGVSLGDIHSLVYPRPKDGGIIRLSIGCEDVEDLLEDFELGLSFVPDR